MSPRLIMTTGITSCGRDEHLQELVAYSAARGKKVKVCDYGNMVFQHAKEMGHDLPVDNVLNIDSKRLDAYRSAVTQSILSELAHEYEDYDAVILKAHIFFFWNERLIRAYDRYMDRFTPDLFVSFIDDADSTLARMKKRSQWKDRGAKRRDILRWQSTEVEVTDMIADTKGKPHYIVAVRQPVSTMYKLIFHPEIEPVYIAMPISHFQAPEDRARIDEFVERLGKYFVVFNPLAVEAVGAVNLKDSSRDKVVDHHTVSRDLHWFVQQSKKLIAYWPKAVPSPGMNMETHHAFMNGKDVWVIFLGPETSPFTTCIQTKLFTDEEGFFHFLEERYPERKALVW